MDTKRYITSVSSARSGRLIAYVQLDVPIASIESNQRVSFVVTSGFGLFLNKYLDAKHFILAGPDNRDYFIRIVSFPTERACSGYFDIDSPVPSPVLVAGNPEFQPNKRNHKLKSWLTRVYEWFE